MRTRTLLHSLLAAALLTAGAPSAALETAQDAPSAANDRLTKLTPEIHLPIRMDSSAMTMVELDASGLYKPDATLAPLAFEQIRKRIGRANYSPEQLDELKTTAPELYQTLGVDAAMQDIASPLIMPSPVITFFGESSDDQITVGEPRYTPPDTNGAVGPNHYVETVNTTWGVFSKATGARILGPQKTSGLFAGFGGPCETTNDGDPIVIYDQLADRWMISQFALPNIGSNAGPFYQCIAVSTSASPTGTWYRYQYLFDNNLMNDYPHFGLWPDGYYATFNMFDFSQTGQPYAGMAAAAFERDKMLLGQTAQMVVFKLNTQPSPVNQIGGGLPASLDGRALPPANSPNIIAAPEAAEWTNYATDRIHFFKFHVDWTSPANSTFTGPVDVNTAAWNSICDTTRACVPQSGSSNNLDAIADRFMWRLAYRNFGSYQAMVVNHTVAAGGIASVRWYEIRDPHAITPTLYQQSTYAPGDGIWRWMGSAAQDGQGNIALGFSGSSATRFPDIRYAGRLQSDPINQLSQGEKILVVGTGSQTGTGNRWGDYSSMTVDPVDDCTFWYSQEVYRASSSNAWSTGIGSFKFPTCGSAVTSRIIGSVASLGTGLPISGALLAATNGTTYTLSALSNASGQFVIPVPSGLFSVSASAYAFVAAATAGIVVGDAVTVTVPMTLTPAPTWVISGNVTEEGSGTPLAASVMASGAPYAVVITATTNPATGFYSLTLPGGGQSWTLTASTTGHGPRSLDLGPIAADQTASFQLPTFSTVVCPGAFASGGSRYGRTTAGNPPTTLSTVGNNVYYRATAFSVSASGRYSMVMTSGLDGFYTLYQNSFTPGSALANALEATDDVIGLNPALYRNLSAGTPYVLVATTYSNNTTGAFTDTLTGFGAIAASCGSSLTPTPTQTSSATPTPTPTRTPTLTPSPTATATGTPTATPSNTPTPSATNTPTATPLPTDTPTNTPTHTPTPTASPTETATSTPSPMSTPTASPNPNASITGSVWLQGRAVPGPAGEVDFVAASGPQTPMTTTFDALSGAFTMTLPVSASGTTYTVTARHALYLAGQTTVQVFAGGIYSLAPTTLRGGDANNTGVISVADLACIGADYGGAPSVCGPLPTSSDINGDGVVTIGDLTLTGGNYEQTGPGPW